VESSEKIVEQGELMAFLEIKLPHLTIELCRGTCKQTDTGENV